jgi:hypothetical protein
MKERNNTSPERLADDSSDLTPLDGTRGVRSTGGLCPSAKVSMVAHRVSDKVAVGSERQLHQRCTPIACK